MSGVRGGLPGHIVVTGVRWCPWRYRACVRVCRGGISLMPNANRSCPVINSSTVDSSTYKAVFQPLIPHHINLSLPTNTINR